MNEDSVRNIMKKLVSNDNEYIEKWFSKPLPSLGMKTPREMIAEGKAARVVAVLTKFLPNGRPNEMGGVNPHEEAKKEIPSKPEDLK